MYFAGNPKAKILVIAQNPGEIKETDTSHMRAVEYLNSIPHASLNEDILKMWYEIDFISSPAYVTMSKVFGHEWLTDSGGIYAYTNSVRCRTPKNSMPKHDMVINCRTWTRNLIGEISPLGIIALGNVAAEQLNALSMPNESMKKHPNFGPMLRLPHFVMWKNEDIERYCELVNTFLKRVIE